MRTRTIIAIIVAVFIAVAMGFLAATLLSDGGSGHDVHTMSNGHRSTGGMSMGGP